jgi:hypothetical protein
MVPSPRTIIDTPTEEELKPVALRLQPVIGSSTRGKHQYHRDGF